MLDVIIRNGLIALPDGIKEGAIGIENGLITVISTSIEANAKTTVDAQGKLVMPGGIDTQVHFREPGLTHKEDLQTGSQSAVTGGITTVFEMPNTSPSTTTESALQDKLNRAKGRMHCDHAFFVGASPENIKQLPSLEQLPGTPGVKIFMGSSTGSLLIDSAELLEQVLANGSHPCSVHSESNARLIERSKLFAPELGPKQHPFLRDAETAVQSTQLLIETAKRASRHVHVLHISSADELPILKGAKDSGQAVTCEVTPQHLFFASPDCYDRLGTLVQMNPPVRDEVHRFHIQKALSTGLFNVFGSDHAPHLLSEKQKNYQPGHEGSPSGMPGVQTLLPMALKLSLEGLLPLSEAIAMLTSAPAALFGIKNKGQMKEGYDADLVIIDHKNPQPFTNAQVKSKCQWTPFAGVLMPPPPDYVFLRGTLVAQNGELVGEPIGQPCQFTWK